MSAILKGATVVTPAAVRTALGCDRVGGALGLGGAQGVEHHGGVAGEVADTGVELGQGDAHGRAL